MKLIKKIILILLVFGFTNCSQKSNNKISSGSCYFLGNKANKNYWISTREAFGGQFNKTDCFRVDSCSGGLGMSGGGCYKWSKTADSQGESWDVRKEM